MRTYRTKLFQTRYNLSQLLLSFALTVLLERGLSYRRFDALLIICVVRLLCSYRLQYPEQPQPLTSFSTLLGRRTDLYIAMFLLFCRLCVLVPTA